jgi:hypothetical protein
MNAWLAGWNPVDLIAIGLFLGFWFWVWRASRKKNNTFVLTDILVDPYSNRGSGAALVYLGLAGLATWYAIRVAVGGGDASNFIVTVLTVFIVKAGADRAFSAWGTRDQIPPPPPCGDEDQATPEEQVIDAQLKKDGVK